ncbi:MAG: hypothetical protein IIB40_01780 [Candidatus Marinimicrobia bacterium]|nr:hypothetical protein [Candidatus Neomarinimicrobiota bacterium]
MGQQQLLLIVLGTIIVGVAIVVGINMFTTGAINAEREALIQDVNNIASTAIAYWRKPAALGGGARDYTNVSFTKIGFPASNTNGVFVISVPTIPTFHIKATGASEGVTVDADIDKDGIVTASLAIVMP